jgi:heptosyltransferase-3
MLSAAKMRILFVTSNRIGDAVLATGLLDHLLRTYPEARFTVACGPAAEGLFARMPRRERTIVFEKRPHSRHWLSLWAATVGTVWSLVVDIRGSALAWVLPARRRVVAHWRRVPRDRHKIAQLGLILGLDPAPAPVTWTAAEDRARAAALLPGGPWVLLGPTANWHGKLWPAERFADLFAVLAAGRLQGARAAVIGGTGQAERAMAAATLAALPQAVDLVGRLSLAEATACIQRAALYVGNDSGLMHLSAAARAPTLGLFGPTKDNIPQFYPTGPRSGMAISPTKRMEDLSVAEVLRAAEALLAPAA